MSDLMKRIIESTVEEVGIQENSNKIPYQLNRTNNTWMIWITEKLLRLPHAG